MNRNSPNMWDHMLICEREKLLTAQVRRDMGTYSFICPPENRLPAELRREHCAISSADEWVELEVRWGLKRVVSTPE